MNGEEMVYSFQQLLNTMSPAFKDSEKLNTFEILDFLNKTVDRYIKDNYFSGSTFKENTARLSSNLDDIQELITISSAGTTPAFVAITGMSNAFTVDLPDDFMGYIRSDSKIVRSTVLEITSASWVPNTEINYYEIGQFLTTPFNIPIIEKPLILFKDDNSLTTNCIVVMDSYTTISDIVYTYVKSPTPIDLNGTNNCQLASYLHEEIVRLAVSYYFDEYKSKLISPK